MLRRAFAYICRPLSLVWLTVHFALTALYVTPPNPLKFQCGTLLNYWIGNVLFAQNWSLFAPNPISSTYSLMVRPLRSDELNVIRSRGIGAAPLDGWYDLSEPLWRRFQENRFSAYERIARPQSNAIRMILGGGQELTPWLQACAKGDKHACTLADQGLRVTRVYYRQLLARIASAYINDIIPDSARWVAIMLRVRDTQAVEWTDRYKRKQPLVKDIDLGVFPLEKQLHGPNILSDRS